ncbi:hypothetical protein KY334_06235, partial [Candidatus Woesearchaeota archaeon]|nr:hypothetical protein [Candidatus Woesearchaeota archaeon]
MIKKNKSIQYLALNFIEKRDNKSFSDLIDRIKPGLTSYIFKYIQDQDIINEVLSQTFISIWEKIDQYNTKYNFSTWAYAIAKNESLGQLRLSNKNLSHDKLSANHSRVLMINSPIDELNIEV